MTCTQKLPSGTLHTEGPPELIVDALAAQGRLDEAAVEARLALERGALDPETAARLWLSLSSIHFAMGRPVQAVLEAENVLMLRVSPEAKAMARVGRLLALMAGGDVARTRAAAEEILSGGERPPTDPEMAGALVALAWISWEEGRVADALSLARAALRRAELGGPGGLRAAYPRLGLAIMSAAIGELDDAAAAVEEASREIDQTGDVLWAAAPQVTRARVDFVAGRLDDAMANASAGLATVESLGTRLWAAQALSICAVVALHRGEPAEAARFVRRFRSEPAAGRVLFGATTFTWIEARLEELEHGPERAWALLAEGDETARPERLMVEEPAAGAWQVSLALAVGDRRRATRLVAISDQVAAVNDTVPSIRAGALHAHGLLERDAASIELAASLQPRPGARAAAHEDAGVVRLEDGEVGPGCEQLQLAEAAYRDASNQRAVVRVRSRLHAARSGKASRPVSGWCSLTETEERVAVVVAEGLTNAQVGTRLFLSRHTIDFHLRQIFRKLEIRSRVELTRLVLERQWPSVGPAAP